MMKYSICILILVVAVWNCAEKSDRVKNGEAVDMTGIFPGITGWRMENAPSLYDSTTLFDYINGAADAYLRYGFEELGTVAYSNEEGQFLTAEVYRHRDAVNAFGIYSSERPEDGTYLSIGTQGYYEDGFLAFLVGRYYVKLIAYDPGEKGQSFLLSLGKDIEERIGEDAGFPPVLYCFPPEGKVHNSERFVPENYLGYDLFHRIFVCRYNNGGEEFEVFISAGTAGSDARKTIKSYMQLMHAQEGVEIVEEEGICTLVDSARAMKNTVVVKARKGYLWGVVSDAPHGYNLYLSKIEDCLEEKNLL
jgi:hypothetical protein